MIILTAGNFRFKKMIKTSIKQSKKMGYTPFVYDLGGLGLGKLLEIKDKSFQEKGHFGYHQGIENRQIRGIHKLTLFRDYYNRRFDFTVYIDGDAILVDKIDEVKGDYDIGLTVRPKEEFDAIDRQFNGAKNLVDGYINAGVMFFNYTEAALRFMDIWIKEAKRLKDDQIALNSLLKRHFPLRPGQEVDIDGVKIRMFDARIYNYYFFDTNNKAYAAIKDLDVNKAKIMHFKGNSRGHYDAFFPPFYKKFRSKIKGLMQ